MQNDELPFPFLLDEAKKRPRNQDGTVGRCSEVKRESCFEDKRNEKMPKEIDEKRTGGCGISIDRKKLSPLLEKVKLASRIVKEAGLDPNSTGGGIVVASVVEQLEIAPSNSRVDSKGVPALTAMAEELKNKKSEDGPKAAHIDKFR